MKQIRIGVSIIVILIFAWLILPVQTQCVAADAERITMEEFKNMFDSKADMVIVDTRSKEAYESGHIPGAISMDYPEDFQVEDLRLPRDKMIVFYCT
jgi:3-mercaptopyruvate sulfurtransferase SseA